MRIIEAFAQFFDGVGDPLEDGWLHFYVSGTTTDKATYSDINETTPNTNPVQLDAEGRCPDIFGTGTYKVVSFTNDPVLGTPDTQIQSFDPVGGSTGTGEFSSWDANTSYAIPNIVTGSDLNFYRSLANANVGNDPTLDATKWEQIELERFYNANITYSQYDRVIDSTGIGYTSLQGSNLNKTPSSNPTYWESQFKPQTSSFRLLDPTDTTKLLAFDISTASTGTTRTIYMPDSNVSLDKIQNSLTASRALVSDGDGFIGFATTTAAEINYVNGLTSAVQTQINNKGIKGWVAIDGVTPQLLASYNLSGSVTDNGTGDYTITWDTDFSSVNYCVAFGSIRTTGSNTIVNIHTKTTGTLRVLVTEFNDTPIDCADVDIIACGVQ